MPRQIKNAKEIHDRADENLARFDVREVLPGKMYDVHSRTDRWDRYMVRVNDDGTCKCECNWGTNGGHSRQKQTGKTSAFKPKSACHHVHAVKEWLAQQEGRRTSAWSSLEDAQRQHRPITELGDGVWLTSRLAA